MKYKMMFDRSLSHNAKHLSVKNYEASTIYRESAVASIELRTRDVFNL